MLVEDTVLIVIGTVLVIVASADAVGTLVTAARHNGRWWPSNVYYRLTGRAWFRVGRRLRPDGARPFSTSTDRCPSWCFSCSG